MRLDPLPHRVNHHHRTGEDTALLCAETEGQRNSGILRGPGSDPTEVAVDRILRRALRNYGPIWRLPRDDRHLRYEHSRRGTLYRNRC